MTQKQFKEGLFRGQGRCILATQAEPDKYYQLVLWACRHELAFECSILQSCYIFLHVTEKLLRNRLYGICMKSFIPIYPK